MSAPVPRAAALLACACVALAVASCSSGGPPARAGNVFDVRQQVSLNQVTRDIDALYQGHPGIASFAVQDVEYTASSRQTVLRECTSGGSGAGSQTAETSQIVACAPLIFFLYSYGEQASVPDSVRAAGELYWYAVTHITGSASARTSLDEVLGSWKVPVPALTPAEARNAVLTSVITAADDSMLGRNSVRIVRHRHGDDPRHRQGGLLHRQPGRADRVHRPVRPGGCPGPVPVGGDQGGDGRIPGAGGGKHHGVPARQHPAGRQRHGADEHRHGLRAAGLHPQAPVICSWSASL